ncbi:borealin [Sphaerodactylus townsendi]|uniref:borealin n=1 Tax=Sphaerodactylus townsendi TaxID=933632 RepID=UPI0020262D58|nr:borealin [Sphaerodactylus townsendi]
MAPSKKKRSSKNPSRSKNVLKRKKMEAFLKDFSQEVETRKERILVESEGFLKEIDNIYNMELLRLPAALQEMNWVSYFALGGGEKALEKAAMADLDIVEITKLATEAIQKPLKTVRTAKKAKQPLETTEDGEAGRPARKRSRQGGEEAGAPESNIQARTSIKRAPGSRRGRPPPARSTRLNRRSAKVNWATPSVGQTAASKGATPLLTPKFDASVFRTPGLRAPAAQERVFSVSENGSPLAAPSDIFITLPAEGGETICLRPNELSRQALMRLDPGTLGTMKKMSAHLANLCGSLKSSK